MGNSQRARWRHLFLDTAGRGSAVPAPVSSPRVVGRDIQKKIRSRIRATSSFLQNSLYFPETSFARALPPYVEAFRSGLADRGYVEGRNLALVLRYGDDHLERVPELVAELVQIPVDLLVAQGAANFLINKLDLPVPVVYGFSGDPVVAGFADSLAKPHANMTGATFMAPELAAKQPRIVFDAIGGPRRRKSRRRARL
jgi:hypothetical protein